MNLNGLVTRIRMSADRPNSILMETVVCDQCGQRFAIHHDPARQSVEVATKQATWVKDNLVWDHIQERKHHGTMELPWLQ